jgi:hypothetical protein
MAMAMAMPAASESILSLLRPTTPSVAKRCRAGVVAFSPPAGALPAAPHDPAVVNSSATGTIVAPPHPTPDPNLGRQPHSAASVTHRCTDKTRVDRGRP